MRIAVIGAGAMGSIYGGHLSLHNEVYLIDTNQTVVDQINEHGLIIQENGSDVTYHPTAAVSTKDLEPMDVIILFVKALFSKAALQSNRHLIGANTYLMTLQNGSGHEDILGEFVPENRIIIGTTEDNGAVLAPGHVRRGGTGKTNIGMLTEDTEDFLPRMKEVLDSCGFQALIHANIQQLIWNKLFTNVSLSAVTGVLQVPMGFIAANEHAWKLTCQLIHEAVAVAHGLGLEADEAEITEKVRLTSVNSPEGITSICADLRAGRKTEVNTISGSVVRASKKCGVPAPTHEMIVELIHAMEER
ncbi:MAG: ketopantoate reductase family protein [Clostridium sp.]|nr:ketopantoate reductase family protein [Lachnospiraceae bacterium]MDD6073022.1 ketopantoate reductase family protein [Clostridium sp.]